MNHRLPLAVAALVVCAGSATLWMLPHSSKPAHAPKTTSAEARQLLSKIPLWFEALPDGRFASQSVGRSVTFDDHSASWKMRGGSSIQMEFQNANQTPTKHGVDKLAARFDSYKGNDPKKWKSGIDAYQKVAYDKLYPGVDLVFYGKGNIMEHDFIVAPHADPHQIRLAFHGASKIDLDRRDGKLTLDTGVDRLELSKPVAYQTRASGERVDIPATFNESGDHSIGFELGTYDANLPLVIDPIVQFSSYYGGSGADEFVALTVDLKSDSVWLVGSTNSTDIVTNGGTLNGANASGGRDVLVAQFVQAGTGQLTIKYASVYGGTGAEEPAAIGVAPNGYVYVVGTTASTDLPTVNPYSSTFQGPSDVFVLALDPTQVAGSSALVYSTFLGGTATDVATSMAIDSSNRVYVAGFTLSSDFPTSSGAILAGNRGGYDPFVAKLDTSAGSSGLLYSTTYGGSSTDQATGVAVDSKGIIYLTGWTYSSDFPISGTVPYPTYTPGGDGFLVAIDPSQSGNAGIVFCTYFGGSGYDQPTAMQLAPNGRLYISGFTNSTDFPIAGDALQKNNNGRADMFLMAFDFKQTPSQWLVYSTYLGGSGDDVPLGMSIDPQNRVNLVGYTHPVSAIPSPTAKAFPTTANAVQPVSLGLMEAVIARIDPSLPAEKALTFSTFWGGALNDVGLGIAADPRGCFLFVAGTTNSPRILTTYQPFQTDLAIGPDAFMLNIDTCTNPPASTTRRTR